MTIKTFKKTTQPYSETTNLHSSLNQHIRSPMRMPLIDKDSSSPIFQIPINRNAYLQTAEIVKENIYNRLSINQEKRFSPAQQAYACFKRTIQ